MKKIVYSLILFLSVSCSSAATQSAPTPEKQEKTASQAKVAQNQSKDFVTFAIHYIEQAKWLFVNTFFVSSPIFLGFIFGRKGIFPRVGGKNTFGKFVTFFIFPLVVTCIAAVLSTCLHFINKKEVKEQGKRLSCTKHFLVKWVPALLPTIFTVLTLFFGKAVNQFLKNIVSDELVRFICQMVILPLCFACLFVAPIATYLIDYMGLTSDDTIKPKKTAQKGDRSFFLTRWAYYSTLIVIYNTIAGLLIQVFLAKKIVNGDNKTRILRASSLSSLIVAFIASLSAWISYTLEKKKNPSEHKTFSNHFLHNAISALLVGVFTSLSQFLYLFMEESSSGAWIKNLDWVDNEGDNNILFTFIYPPPLCCVIIAPILALIETYIVTKKSAQPDSSEKGHEEAQSKADII